MLAGRIAELSAEDLVDLRATGLRVRLDSDEHAEAVSAAARDLGLAANPAALQQLSIVLESADPSAVRPFWQRALDYAPGDDGGLADPLRRDPDVRIRQSTEPRPLRNRIHLDVVRPAAAVEQAGLGEAYGAYGVCHADPDGNEVDLVPGDALSEKAGTADWQAVFSAMACYRTTSPTQQRDLVASAAALADDVGFPLLVDLRPGLVIIDSGKDQWVDDAHGLELDFTDLAGDHPDRGPRARGHGGSGAAALRAALLRCRRRRRGPRVLARRTRIHPRPASLEHRHLRSSAAEPGAGVPGDRPVGDGASSAAQPDPRRARCGVGPRAVAPRGGRRSRWPAPGRVGRSLEGRRPRGQRDGDRQWGVRSRPSGRDRRRRGETGRRGAVCCPGRRGSA